MVGFSSPFGPNSEGEEIFDDYGEFVPNHVPVPGQFLSGHDVLAGQAHVDFHRTTKEIFEERGVYDMTFGYNLARLNLDDRHPKAGYRYAEENGDPSVLRAEFTPTTPFCPQSDTLTKGSFRAWNGLRDRHEYDLVRVRVHEMHHRCNEINDTLAELEAEFRETGTVTTVTDSEPGRDQSGSSGCSDGPGSTSRGYSPDAPF